MPAPCRCRPRPTGVRSRLMRRCRGLAVAVAMAVTAWGSAAVGLGVGGPAGAEGRSVDTAILTAVDVSDSITRHEEWRQYQALATALEDPEFVAAATRGGSGATAIAVQAYASNDTLRTVVPWTALDGPSSAAAIAARVRAAPRIDRSDYTDNVDRGRDSAGTAPPSNHGLRTDLGMAIAQGAAAAVAAPGRPLRRVVNVLSDGVDNAGPSPRAARDAAVAQGVTVNALVFGDAAARPGYFRAEVVGGPGAFVLAVPELDGLALMMRRKLLMDLVQADIRQTPASR